MAVNRKNLVNVKPAGLQLDSDSFCSQTCPHPAKPKGGVAAVLDSHHLLAVTS